MSGARDAFDRIRSQAEKMRGGGDSFTCRCPAHEDRDPSLSVKLDGDRVLLHCHAGCEAEAIVRAFGLELRDLFDRDPNYRATGATSRPRLRPTANPTTNGASYSDAAGIATDEANDDAHRPPIPCTGLATALDMLRSDPRIGIAQLRAVAASEDWGRLAAIERAMLTEWAKDHAGRRTSAVAATIGTVDRSGRHRPAMPDEPDIEPLPDTLAGVCADDAETVAHNIFIAGRLGFLHGPGGGGKTSVCAMAAAAVTRRGMLFGGKVSKTRPVIICTEDPETWRRMVESQGGDLDGVKLRRWSELPAAVRESEAPPAVAVDTLQHAAADAGGTGATDKPEDVDRILRPLAALTRETGAAITVIDHEPWAEGDNVETKKRPRGSTAKVATPDFIMHVEAVKDEDGKIVSITVEPSEAKGARMGINVDRMAVNLEGRRVDAPARGRGPAGGAAVPTKDAMLDILRRMPAPGWLSKTKLLDAGGWSARRWVDGMALLGAMVDEGLVEQEPGRQNPRYRAVVEPAGESLRESLPTHSAAAGVGREPLREGGGAAPNPTPIDLSEPLRSRGVPEGLETDHEPDDPEGVDPEGGSTMNATPTEAPTVNGHHADPPCMPSGSTLPTTTTPTTTTPASTTPAAGAGDDWEGGDLPTQWEMLTAPIHPDALWYRDTPGGPDNRGEHVQVLGDALADALNAGYRAQGSQRRAKQMAYLRRLDAVELDQELSRQCAMLALWELGPDETAQTTTECARES